MNINKQNVGKSWYNLTVSDGTLIIESDDDPKTDASAEGASVDIITQTDSSVAITKKAELVAYEHGDVQDGLRAHLARYNADSDSLTLLF